MNIKLYLRNIFNKNRLPISEEDLDFIVKYLSLRGYKISYDEILRLNRSSESNLIINLSNSNQEHATIITNQITRDIILIEKNIMIDVLSKELFAQIKNKKGKVSVYASNNFSIVEYFNETNSASISYDLKNFQIPKIGVFPPDDCRILDDEDITIRLLGVINYIDEIKKHIQVCGDESFSI